MMALSCGADLVLELPALYATRSAYWFALGGVTLLAAAGVTHLAFGAETDDLPALLDTANRLAHPDKAYRDALHNYLHAGLSFSEAQAKALDDGNHASFVPSLPNDRLALSYLQASAEKGLALKPILVPRTGNAFHDTALPTGNASSASATAIRRRLEEGADLYSTRKLSTTQLRSIGIARYIPDAALPYLANTQLVFPSDAAPTQLALLRRADIQALADLPDATEGLEYRVQNAASRAGNLDIFYKRLKTKRYPLTRLQRLTAHLLIDYREAHAARIADGAPYIRILGANGIGRQLLHQIKKTSPIPIIAKTSQIKALAESNPHAAAAWDLELRATAMYSLLRGDDYAAGNPEYMFSPMM
jgi:predicted nucleotidyltransferase